MASGALLIRLLSKAIRLPPSSGTCSTPAVGVAGASANKLFLRCFGGDGTVRENAAGDVLASLTTMVWNAPSKSWTGGAVMAHSSLNRRVTVRTSSRQADLLVPALVQLLAVAPQQVRLGQQPDDAAGLGAV